MEYVEILRARRVLIWYCGVLVAILAISVISLYSGHANIHSGVGTIPLSALIVGCAGGAMIVATCVAPGLNAESLTLPITWTRPTPRESIALRYIAVDLATILIGYAFTLAIALTFFAIFGLFGEIAVDGGAVGFHLLNGLGCAFMWYGLVSVVAARMNGRGGLIAGLSWAAFLVLGVLWTAPFPQPIHAILTVLNYFDPLTYFWTGAAGSANAKHHVLILAPEILTLIAWGFVVVTLAATVRLWSTREV